MTLQLHRLILGFLVVLLVVGSEATIFGDPGFGTIKKRRIELQVRRPALVLLANTSIAFKGSAASAEYASVVGSLESTLETELVSNERTLVKKSDPTQSDWVLNLTVTGYAQPRAETVAGTTTVRWTGSLNVAYQVLDREGRVHDADNVATTSAPATTQSSNRLTGLFKPDSGANSAEEVKQAMIKSVVVQIASNLGNTVQAVEAQVAAGDALDRVADFLDQHLWARALEELEKVKPYVKEEDEAYRQYDLGLTYEAMSYDAKNATERRANLFKAQEYYDKATEMNPKQKYFVEVIARTKESVARYHALDAMLSDQQKKAQTARNAAAPAGAAAASAKASSTKAVTVTDVIEMYSSGVDQPQIIEIIRSSPVEFALDKDTALAVAKAKLPVALQNELRKKAGLPALAAAPAVAKPATAPVPRPPAAGAKPAAPATK